MTKSMTMTRENTTKTTSMDVKDNGQKIIYDHKDYYHDLASHNQNTGLYQDVVQKYDIRGKRTYVSVLIFY